MGYLVVIFAVIGVAALIALIVLAPDAATERGLRLARRAVGLRRKEITLPSGLRYVYLEGGAGEPLVLLHGFGANKDNFTMIARYLRPRFRVIVPDHIGFGESAHPEDAPYFPLAQAERIHEFVHALGIEKFHLGGSSMGGQIALSYAAQYPEDVKSLWLLAPAGMWTAPQGEVLEHFQRTGKNPLMASNVEEFMGIATFVMSRPPKMPKFLMKSLAKERMLNFALEERIFQEIVSDSIEERIRGLATPALIVWGDQDRAINVKTVDLLKSLLPNSSVQVYKNIGHSPMLECPRRTAQDFMAFVSGLADTTR